MEGRRFVAVHAGAGLHPSRHRQGTLRACRAAVRGAIKLDEGVAAVAEAVRRLEDCPLTNAGIGSNLTLSETIECDASLMDGSTRFAAVGAVSFVQNPITLAHRLLDHQKSFGQGDDLIAPTLLVSTGATSFAKSIGMRLVEQQAMLSDTALSAYRRSLAKRRPQAAVESSNENGYKLDTVGAVYLDKDNGSVAAACSSGGILLKHAGRVGHAATFGAGCWAHESETFSVAVSTSGCGEYLARTHFAMNCARHVTSGAAADRPLAQCLDEFFRDHFLHSALLHMFADTHKLAGALVLRVDKRRDEREFAWLHNTPTMALAYGASTVGSLMSEQPNDNMSVLVQSVVLR